MKRNFYLLFAGLISTILVASCSTSSDVASSGIIQKRKYTKGFFVKSGFKTSKFKKVDEADILVEADETKNSDHNIVKPTAKAANYAEITPETGNTVASLVDVREVSNSSNDQNTSKARVEKKSVKLVKVLQSATKLSHVKAVKSQVKNARKQYKLKKSDEIDPVLLYVLCFFVPFVAVGLVTDWDTNQVLLNLLLCLLCGIPGIIHALVVVSKNV